MKIFKRYLLHFSAIGLIAFIIGLLAIHNNEKLFSMKFIPFLFLAILVYVLPMSYIFSKMAECHSFRIEGTSPELISKLDKLFLYSGDPKRIKENSNGVIYYVYENKYSAWLAERISVVQSDGYTIVYAPKRYKNKIEAL